MKDRSGFRLRQRLFDLGHQRTKVLQAVAHREHDNLSDTQPREILLELQGTITRQEHVKSSYGRSKELAVLQPGPALLVDGVDFECRKFTPKVARHILIEEDTCHAILASNARPASSRNATACTAGTKLETLYDEARAADPRLPEPVFRVFSKLGLARLFAELGPITDFASWRQAMRYGGVNLRERQSGRYRVLTRIARRGRPELRRILNQLTLPLVREGFLFGPYYARKTQVEHMAGPKAMMAVSRKILKLIWGWYHSERGFDASRVFQCRALHAAAA